ncbi:imidazolonepropionase [Corallococcus macrosporus]|uniref:imidazolonepropionase n=1 Tax=Myxococcus fulvus (strain ATCC BAA-855 / HW-1) TaxID=483219 RepID=F8CN46_MYXFH|nr:imidazolonepropionase [Corallococcus macrosporus]
MLTVEGTHRERAEDALTPKPGAVVGVRGGRIAYVGPEAGLPAGAVGPDTEVVDALGGFVGPGFVDPHTHLVFAGERSTEFDLRNQGATYLELAKAGGGIAGTVRATRAASEDELVRLALPRAHHGRSRRTVRHGRTGPAGAKHLRSAHGGRHAPRARGGRPHPEARRRGGRARRPHRLRGARSRAARGRGGP